VKAFYDKKNAHLQQQATAIPSPAEHVEAAAPLPLAGDEVTQHP
jgi:hypothetical protein